MMAKVLSLGIIFIAKSKDSKNNLPKMGSITRNYRYQDKISIMIGWLNIYIYIYR